MRRFTLLGAILAIILVSTSSYAAPIISIAIDGVDSASQNEMDLLSPGDLDVALVVSGVTTERIFELQFDIALPAGLTWTGAPAYGPAVASWGYLQGGIVPDQQNVYREFSTEFKGGDYPLANGQLLSGLRISVPDDKFPCSFELGFSNVEGDGTELITFKPLTVNAVPIPPALVLLASGLAGIIGLRRRRK